MSRTPHHRFLVLACLLAVNPGSVRGASGGPQAPVVGGEPAVSGKWPDAAAVMNGGFAFCSGTLVAPQVVLTAGHCVDGSEVDSVLLGAVDSEGPGEKIPVVQAIAYPDWPSAFDIGVLVLAHPSTIAPRPIATDCVVEESLVNRAPVTLVGFGATTRSGDDYNTTLMEARAEILDAACTDERGCESAISPGGEFVAGGGGVDSCFGDSGGPVYLHTPHGVVLAGVVSRGLNDAKSPCGDGGIDVRPDPILDWIEEAAGQPIERAVCSAGPMPSESDMGGGCAAGGRAIPAWPILLALLVAVTRLRRARARRPAQADLSE